MGLAAEVIVLAPEGAGTIDELRSGSVPGRITGRMLARRQPEGPHLSIGNTPLDSRSGR